MMHRLVLFIFAALVPVIAPARAWAQMSESLHRSERAAIIAKASELLLEHYISEDIASECVRRLQSDLDAGVYDALDDPEAFAEALTTALQAVSHDKHMRVRVKPEEPAHTEVLDPAQARARRAEDERLTNYGIDNITRFEGNIGYVDIRAFSGAAQARDTAAGAFQFLANTDALIFDLRHSDGGSPRMVQFLCTYLFDQPTHLNTLHWPRSERTNEFWTLEEFPIERRPDVPVLVLTGSKTFSAAEEFCYNLQALGRATLVGQRTFGGANPGRNMNLDDQFTIFVPSGQAINPTTGTNWEGVGVIPDIEIPENEALDHALTLARQAAQAFRETRP